MQVVPPGHWIELQLAYYEAELRESLRGELASESSRKVAEIRISDALVQRERELVAQAQQLGSLPVLW
jgi:hypothetical protein